MGEKNYLIIGKKQPGTLKIQATESVGAQLHTAPAMIETSGILFFVVQLNSCKQRTGLSLMS